jgi:7-cyano-7-deazaguanine tRNA-ribosyltransferase
MFWWQPFFYKSSWLKCSGRLMSFEIKEKDLLGRIGRLKTKSGSVETPLLFPVVNPRVQPISPRSIKEKFGFDAVITNSYIIKKSGQEKAAIDGLHKFLDFDGVVMTDSGAYQILIYGDVEVTPHEIVEYQEQIGSDIATILDIPTGWRVPKEQAEQTVEETLRRAKNFFKIKKREDILWVGPVQGGRHLDLVAKSASEMGKLPFQVHALGSPTEVMECYRFEVLVDMILTAKIGLPVERPLHLFGAGHPFMFSIAVALGCDLFDSAAYALYARENRYMTENGTWRLNELDYFPCSCPNCANTSPKIVLEKPKSEIELFLAEHNLYVCRAEMNRIKQAIREGRLWEHAEMRAHAHPALLTALKRVKNYEAYIEKYSPVVKKSGFFFFDSDGLARPEVVHYRNRLMERYSSPRAARILLLVPQTRNKPFHKAQEFRKIRQIISHLPQNISKVVHVCFYAAPFGIIPLELDEVYPLSQHETALPLSKETVGYVACQVASYLSQNQYETVVLLHDPKNWDDSIQQLARKVCTEKREKFEYFDLKAEASKDLLTRLEMVLKNSSGEQS